MSDLTRSEFAPAPRVSAVPPPRFETALVPRNSISGRALVAVVAIMTFLASLTTGGVILVSQAASQWQSEVSREVTVQLIPTPGRDLDADVARAASVVKNFSGIADVRPYTKEESAKLLEPWLGTGLTLDELPVPRLIVVKIARGAAPDLPQLAIMLKGQVPGAVLDADRVDQVLDDQPGVANDGHIGDPVLADLGRVDVSMHNRRVRCETLQRAGDPVVEAGAQRDDQVCPLQREHGRDRAVHAWHAQVLWV